MPLNKFQTNCYRLLNTSRVRIYILALLGCLFPMLALADDPPPAQVEMNFQAPGDYSASQASVDSSETIDPFTGSLILSYEDLRLPAAGGLDLVITRTYQNLQNAVTQNPYKTSNNGRSMLGPGWDIHFGRVWPYASDVDWDTMPANDNKAACRTGNPASNKNPVLELGDGSKKLLLDIDAVNNFSFRTKDDWAATCLPVADQLYTQGGLIVYSPDGKKYIFNEWGKVVVSSAWGSAKARYAYLVTQIQDYKGNKINISYKDFEGYRVIDTVSTLSVDGSIGPDVTFNYSNHMLTSITGEGLTVTYQYAPFTPVIMGLENPYHLTQVIMPETNYQWDYSYYDYNAGGGTASLETVTNPAGMQTTYTYGKFHFNSSSLYCGEENCTNIVVTQKEVNGGGVEPSTWTYDYQVAFGANDISSFRHIGYSCTVYEHEGEHAHSPDALGNNDDLYRRGLLVRKTFYGSDSCQSYELQDEIYEYNVGLALYPFGGNLQPTQVSGQIEYRPNPQTGALHTWRALMTKKTIERDGNTWVTDYSNFTNNSGTPQTIVESGIGFSSRTITRTIADGISFGICTNIDNCYVWYGIPFSETINSQGVMDSEKSYQWTAPGKVASITDNAVQTAYLYSNNYDPAGMIKGLNTADISYKWYGLFGNYYRGSPNRVDVLTQDDQNGDGTSSLHSDIISNRVYDPRGNMTSETRTRSGETGATTIYTYDLLNHLTSITTPRTDDNNIFYEYAVSGSGYYVTEKRGPTINNPSVSTVKHYNGAGALLDEVTTDHNSSVSIYKKYNVDELNRTVVESFPSYTPIATINNGIVTKYDNLNRVTKKTYLTGGSLSATSTEYDYLPNGKERITNELGVATILSYQSYGDLDAKQLIKIEQEKVAGGSVVTTDIDRNSVGRINSISQGGSTHSFTYFIDRRMQVETETLPEVGTIQYTRQQTGEVSTRQFIPNVGSPSGITYFDYNYQNQLMQIDYPNPTEDVFMAYNMFGQIKHTETMTNDDGWVNCFAATFWEPLCNSVEPRTVLARWSNNYDLNQNLTQEQLAYGGLTHTYMYGYDQLDHLQTITYPNNDVLTYALDKLGRTKGVTLAATPLASAINYFPNGQLSGFSLGNGRAASFTQTSRLQPKLFSVDNNTLNQTYSYNPIGNITNIADSVSVGTRSNIQYDGLNRLSSVQFPGSVVHGFTYNDHGDIESKVVSGGANAGSWDLIYDPASKRLASVSGTTNTTLSHDGYGNVTSLWGNAYTFDDANNLLTATTPKGTESYGYDAYNRRVKVTNQHGSYISLYSSAGKLMTEIDNNGLGNSKNHFYLGEQAVAYKEDCTVAGNIALGVCSWLDEDGDNLDWSEEVDNHTNPFSIDTDGDGLPDPIEVQKGIDPTDSNSATLPLDADYKGGTLSTQGVTQ